MPYTDLECEILKLVRNAVGLEHAEAIRPRYGALCDHSIGRIFLSYVRHLQRQPFAAVVEDQNWQSRIEAFVAIYRMQIVETLDWLLRASTSQHPWIENVDAHGRPKKLMKCNTMETLYAECIKSMSRLPSYYDNTPDHKLGPADERLVCDLPSGNTLVELLTPSALDVESMRMRHCIGHGGYDDKLLSIYRGNLFSVRDRDGEPLATIETHDRTIDGVECRVIRQFVGPGNIVPPSSVVADVQAVMLELGWHMTTPSRADTPTAQQMQDDEDLAAAFARGFGLR